MKELSKSPGLPHIVGNYTSVDDIKVTKHSIHCSNENCKAVDVKLYNCKLYRGKNSLFAFEASCKKCGTGWAGTLPVTIREDVSADGKQALA